MDSAIDPAMTRTSTTEPRITTDLRKDLDMERMFSGSPLELGAADRKCNIDVGRSTIRSKAIPAGPTYRRLSQPQRQADAGRGRARNRLAARGSRREYPLFRAPGALDSFLGGSTCPRCRSARS